MFESRQGHQIFMAKLLRIFLIFLLLIVLVAAGAAVYAIRHSSDVLITQIEKNLGVKASVAEVTYLFPSTIVIRDLRVGDQIEVERLVITPSIIGFFQKKTIVFNEILITSPRVRVVRRADETIDVGLPQSKEPPAAPEKPSRAPAPASGPAGPKKKAPSVYVEHLRVIDGRVAFVDEALGTTPPFRADVVDIRLETKRVSLLEPMRLQFELSVKVGEGEGVVPGRLDGTGQYDLLARKGTARLDVVRVPLVLFEPYYAKYVKKKIQAGTVTVGGDFRVDGNDLAGDCRISLEGMAFQEETPEDGDTAKKGKTWKDIGKLVVSSMFLAAGETTFDVSFKTRLDRPRFENVKLKGSFSKPGSLAPFAVEGSGASVEDFKKIGEEFEAIGKEFKKMFDF